MTQSNKQKHRKLGGNLITLKRKERRQFKLIVIERITFVDQKDPNYLCLTLYVMHMTLSLCGLQFLVRHAYNKNVTSFL
jgi:hypothetical protein